MRKLPHYGVGIEWAFELENALLEDLEKFELIELIPENFFRQGKRFLKRLADLGTPTIIHGVELSLGSAEPIKAAHFDLMREVADQINVVKFTEHLAMTEFGGVEIGQLTPLPFTRDAADIVSEKITQIQKQISVPFAIENVTNRFLIPNCELSEPEFINRITKNTGCGLQLDLNNLDTNAYNYKYDAYEWLKQIDLDTVASIHLAGGHFDEEGTLLDSHSDPVRDRVWLLYSHVTDRVLPSSTIVEWTDDTPPLSTLLSEIAKARSLLYRHTTRAAAEART
jgi:uncharacterized protein (UPF0276 family)